MKIMYVHGFASKFDINSDKVKILSELGNVCGVTIDYSKSFISIRTKLIEFAKQEDVDLIVGTSMGGFYSLEVATALSIPCVIINPVTFPHKTLEKYIGDNVDFNGNRFTLLKSTVDDYPITIRTNGCCLVLLEKGDELIPYMQTQMFLTNYYEINVTDNGNHRYSSLKEKLELIKQFLVQSVCNGF